MMIYIRGLKKRFRLRTNQETINTIKPHKRINMKKLLTLAIIASMALFTGCTTQPMPTGVDGKSKSSVKVGTDAHVFTLIDKISFGGTVINAEDGSSIIVSPNQPKSTPLTF